MTILTVDDAPVSGQDETVMSTRVKQESPCLLTVTASAIFGALLALLAATTTILVGSIGFFPSILLTGIILTAVGSFTLWNLLGELRKGTSVYDLKKLLNRRESAIHELVSMQSELSGQVEARESELTRSYKYFRQLMKTFDMATFHCDLENRFEWAHNFVGDGDALIGKKIEEILPEDASFLLSLLVENACSDHEIHTGQLEFEVGGEMRHYRVQVAPRFDRNGNLNGSICVSNDVTEKVRWDEHLAKMILEVNHRARNLLAIIVSMLRQTSKTAKSVEDYKEKITDRVSSLAKSIELISKDSWTATSLNQLVQIQLQHACPNAEHQIEISGTDVCLAPKAIQNIGLAIHELSTNAKKFGALSHSSGIVQITWQINELSDQTPILNMRWKEHSENYVESNQSRGLGLTILENIVAQELDANSELNWNETGLEYTLTLGEEWFETTPLITACNRLETQLDVGL